MESQDVAPSAAVADADWGWICTQLYENRERWKGLVECNGALREAVVQHYQRWPADPGLDAASAAWTSAQQAFIADHYRLGKDDTIIWKRLKAQGYVVIDWKDENQKTNSESFSLATTLEQQERLSEYYLHETTCQGDTVRTDRVHFLSRAEAVASGMEGPYDFLMGLAHYGNDHWHPVAPSSRDMQPIPPATLERPFTIPKCLQFAEYGHGDFYTVRG